MKENKMVIKKLIRLPIFTLILETDTIVCIYIIIIKITAQPFAYYQVYTIIINTTYTWSSYYRPAFPGTSGEKFKLECETGVVVSQIN